MAVYGLDDKLWFPDPHEGEPDGLVAVYGDLSPERLLLAYSNGYFPWYSYRATAGAIFWYCPLDRFVIFPDEIHVSHSMRQMMRSDTYEVTFNEDFPAVIHNCSTAQQRNVDFGAWLGPDMIDAYTRMHRLGYASSVEVWERDSHRLVGGLYGITLCDCFFGESMFSLVPSASKLALIHLARKMKEEGGKLIDCQFETPHLLTMGGRHISYEQYMEILRKETGQEISLTPTQNP